MPIELRKLSTLQIKELPKERTVFFFPVGPIEDHGPHLPVGMDLEEAERLSLLAARHLEEEKPGWRGVVMPSAPLSVEGNTTQFAIVSRPYILRDWLVDACRVLIKSGFIHFVCFSGHLGPRQLTAIEEAGKRVRRIGLRSRSYWVRWRNGHGSEKASLISAQSALIDWKRVSMSPFWPDPVEHGGKRDTSVALAISPQLVRADYKDLPAQPRERSRWARNWKRRRGLMRGYWGDPAKASAEEGEKEILQVMDELFPKMNQVWEGKDPNKTFRTWYSVLPPNTSFFKAWTLAILIVICVLGWASIMLTLLDFRE